MLIFIVLLKVFISRQLYINYVILLFTGPSTGEYEVLHIAIGTSISVFFFITLVICAVYHRRKFRPVRKPVDRDHVEVRYVAASSSCNTTDRLLVLDQNEGQTVISPVQSPTGTPKQVTNMPHNHVHSGNSHGNNSNSSSHSNMNAVAHSNDYANIKSHGPPGRGTPTRDMPLRDTPPRGSSTPPESTPVNGTSNQTNISTVNRTNHRPPRIQKVSIV